MKTTKLFIFTILMPFIVKSQDLKEKILIEGGYTYFNRSFADVGVKYLFDEKAIY